MAIALTSLTPQAVQTSPLTGEQIGTSHKDEVITQARTRNSLAECLDRMADAFRRGDLGEFAAQRRTGSLLFNTIAPSMPWDDHQRVMLRSICAGEMTSCWQDTHRFTEACAESALELRRDVRMLVGNTRLDRVRSAE